MNCTVSMLDQSLNESLSARPFHHCERPMGHGGLHRYTHSTWKSEPPTRTVVEFTTDGKTAGSAVLTGGWLP